MKILMVEDNISVCTMTEMFFFKEGFEAEFVHDGVEGYQRFTEEDWDLVILDIMLPSMDGVTICRKIRETSSVPIIMLTAKDTESDQVIGFEMGADDYVTKPFSPLTLVARIKAVIRRYRATGQAVKSGDLIETACFSINKKTREVFLHGKPVENLTPKEFDLLFISHKIRARSFRESSCLSRCGAINFTAMNVRLMFILNGCAKTVQ